MIGMSSMPGYLVDTNILLGGCFCKDDPLHELIKATLSGLNDKGTGLYFSLQNIAEFWNTCTRPADRNGYGLTTNETNECAKQIERTMTYLPDTNQVYSTWRRLVVSHNVRGVQVHDASLAAIMQAYSLTQILTLNQPDFLRYAGIQPVHPNQVPA